MDADEYMIESKAGILTYPTYINCQIIPRSDFGIPRSIAFASSWGCAAAKPW